MRETLCPFCGLHPYEYVDVGLGERGVAVAVNCCEWGPLLFDWRTSKEDASKASGVAARIESGELTMDKGRDELERLFQIPQ